MYNTTYEHNVHTTEKEIKMKNNYTELDMFGCSIKELDIQFGSQYNINMYIAGLLSDAQELNLMGKTDQANQLMNQVKHYFFEYTNTRNQIPAVKQD